MTLDLTRLDQAQRDRDMVAHEAAHAVAAVLFGLEVLSMRFDRHADFGWLGQVEASRPAPAVEEDRAFRRARAIAAAIGPIAVGESLDLPSSAADLAIVRETASPNWPLALWKDDVEQRARSLLRREEFGRAHVALIVAAGDGTRDLDGPEIVKIVREALET